MLNWKSIRESQWKAREERLLTESVKNRHTLPTKSVEQMEFESIVGPIDDYSAFVRHKEAMARRAFTWYRLSKLKNRNKLIDIYNQCALLGKKSR